MRNFYNKIIVLTPARELFYAGIIFFFLAIICRPAFMETPADYTRKPLLDPAGLLQVHAWQAHNLDQYQAGHFPLWNRYTGMGQPHLANIQTGSFFPTWALWMALGGSAALYGSILIFRLWLTAMFWFVFSRKKLCGFPGALLGASVYAFGGYAIPFAQLIDLNSQMLLPLLMLAFAGLIHKPDTKMLFGSALLVCLALWGGHPSAAFVTVLVALVYALISFLAGNHHKKVLPQRFLVLAGAGVLGALFSAAVLIPFLNYLPRCWSMHGPGFGVFHLDPHGFFNLFLPGLHSLFQNMPARIPIEHLEKGPLEMLQLPYLDTAVPGALPAAGPLVCVLAIFGAVRARRTGWNALFFLGLFSVAAGLTFGLPGFRLIALVPPFNVNSNFKFFFSEIHVCVAMLAGVGMERLVAEARQAYKNHGKPRGVLIYAAFFALLAAFFIIDIDYLAATFWARTLIPLTFLAIILCFFLSRHAALIAVCVCVLFGVHDRARSFRPFVSIERPEAEKKAALVAAIESRLSPGSRATGLGRYWPPNLLMNEQIKDVRSSDALFYKPYVNLIQRVNGHGRKENIDYFYPSYYTRPTSQGLASPEARNLSAGLALGRNAWLPAQIVDGVILKGKGVYGVAVPSKLYYDMESGDRCGSFPRPCHPGLFLHAPAGVSFRPAEVMGKETVVQKGLAGVVSFLPLIGYPEYSAPDDAGAGFLAVEKKGPRHRLLYWRYITPFENIYENRAGSPVKLETQSRSSVTLATTPGPKNNRDRDWSAFAALSVHAGEYRPPPVPVWSYNKGAPYIYEVPHKPWAHVKGSSKPLSFKREADDSFLVKIPAKGDEQKVVVHEAWYPGWKAQSCEESLKITASPDLTAFSVTAPKGAEEVFFYFAPLDFKTGLFVSISALLISLVFMVVSIKLRRRSESG